MKRRVTALFATLALLISMLTVPVMATSTVSAGATARDSVAVVLISFDFYGGGEQAYSYGSGFFVGNTDEPCQYLVTNHHVIETYLEMGKGEYVSTKLDNDEEVTFKVHIYVIVDNSTIEAYVVDYDEIADVAVLRLESATDQRTPIKLCVPTEDMVGSTVYAVGYPSLSDNAYIDSITTWGRDDATVTKGSVNRLLTTSGSGERRIQTDAAISSGNSGGPLVNENGAVLGVNVSTYTRVSGNTVSQNYYAVNIEEAITLLNLHSVPYVLDDGSTSPPPTEDSSEESVTETEAATETEAVTEAESAAETTPVAEATTAAETTTEASTEAPGPGPNSLPIIPIAICIAVVVVLVVVLLTRKKGSGGSHGGGSDIGKTVPGPAPGPGPAHISDTVPSPNPADSGFRIQTLSGAIGNKRFMLRTNEELIMGRNPDACNIVFPANTPGVSGRHCAVWCDQGKVYIRDLGSSNGTFIEPGQRLAANQPVELRPGTQFYLGSRNEVFVIAVKGG